MDQDKIEELVKQLVISSDPNLILTIHQTLLNQAIERGIRLSSIYPFYQKIATQKLTGFTVPAINLRTMTYDLARAVFKIAKATNSTAFIFEIARSEQNYTRQSPAEFASYIIAAAIVENYSAPIFIQGDHYQIDVNKFAGDKLTELDDLKQLIADSILAGFYNIDIDASTLVNYNHPTVDQQQQENCQITADLISYIRNHQPKDIVINVGGEIGHIGGKNSTVEEADIFCSQLKSYLGNTQSISKLSIQTGTQHGGLIDEQGKIKMMSVDFGLIKTIGEFVKNKYEIAGVVQHGASTLPESQFNQFPKTNTLEIHLSTKFQNIIFENMATELRKQIDNYLMNQHIQEWDSSWTEAQFIYRTRKKALGDFKKELFLMNEQEKKPIIDEFSKTIEIIFRELNISQTAVMIQ